MKPHWKKSINHILIDKNQVHLWRAKIALDFKAKLESLLVFKLLNKEEQTRALRYQFAKDQIKFAFCRAWLREVLSLYLEESPQELQFFYGPQGKPYLKSHLAAKGSTSWLQFNLSHAEDRALLGVTRHVEVGVDLEKLKEKPQWPPLAKRYFSQEEISFLKKLPQAKQQAAGYKIWTLKEAFSKAKGRGILKSLKSLVVLGEGFSHQANFSTIKVTNLEEESPWSFYQMEPFEGYVGAMVVEGKSASFEFFEGESFFDQGL